MARHTQCCHSSEHNHVTCLPHILSKVVGAVPELPPQDYRFSNIVPGLGMENFEVSVHSSGVNIWLNSMQLADQCLSVYGIDFVVDDTLNPWILEVVMYLTRS